MRIKEVKLKENEFAVLLQMMFLMAGLLIICYLMNLFGVNEANQTIVDVVAIGSVTIFIIIQFTKFELTDWQRLILFAGYVGRIFVMFIDIYGANYVTILHSGDDAIAFYRTAVAIYENGWAEREAAYTRMLSRFFELVGANRVLAQYLNVLCFVGTVIVILCCIKRFPIERRYKTWILAFLCFMPNYICLSSILLRESSMIFFDTLSLYFFICWMQSDKWRDFLLAFIAAAPAIIFHSASIGMWISYIIIAMVWDWKRKKIRCNRRSGLFLGMALMALLVIEVVPALRDMLLYYIPSDFSWRSLSGRYFVDGGSDYLRDISVNSWSDFFYWSPVRMLYFILSPMPTDWRGMGDAFAFVVDSLPIIVLSVGIGIGLRKNQNFRYALVGILCCLAIVGIFAWGVSNAGTAMRHRGLLIGVFAITYCISKSKQEG